VAKTGADAARGKGCRCSETRELGKKKKKPGAREEVRTAVPTGRRIRRRKDASGRVQCPSRFQIEKTKKYSFEKRGFPSKILFTHSAFSMTEKGGSARPKDRRAAEGEGELPLKKKREEPRHDEPEKRSKRANGRAILLSSVKALDPWGKQSVLQGYEAAATPGKSAEVFAAAKNQSRRRAKTADLDPAKPKSDSPRRPQQGRRKAEKTA